MNHLSTAAANMMSSPTNNRNKASPQRHDAPPGVMPNNSFSPPQQNSSSHQVAVSGSISSKDSLGSPGSNGSPLPFHPFRGSFAGNHPQNDYYMGQRVGDFVVGGQYASPHANQQDTFHSPPRNVPTRMEGVYPPPHHSPYASPPPVRNLYPETNQPQPMRYTSGPPHHHDSQATPPPPYHYPPYLPPPPPHHPMMAPTPSTDSSYSAYPPYPYPVHHHPSFESHASGSASTNGGQPPTPYMTYSYPPSTTTTTVIAYPHHYPPPWAPRNEYISKIEPEDVLCGRGGATNSHSGNRAFRVLVKRHQDGYLKAKKSDKPAVASKIVDLIRERGGRFLRRCETTSPNGNVLWVDIGNVRAREKTAQALREGAPEIRRRKSKSFEEKTSKRKDSSDDGEESSTEGDKKDGDSSPRKQVKRAKDEPERKKDEEARTPSMSDARDDNEGGRGGDSNSPPSVTAKDNKDPPAVIRPSARLMKRSTTTEITMAELTPQERELYLRDFLPPDATTKNGKQVREVYRIARHYTPVAEGDDDDDSMMDKDEDEWVQEERE